MADDEDIGRIADALTALAEVEPSLSELVDLKVFCGLSISELARQQRTLADQRRLIESDRAEPVKLYRIVDELRATVQHSGAGAAP